MNSTITHRITSVLRICLILPLLLAACAPTVTLTSSGNAFPTEESQPVAEEPSPTPPVEESQDVTPTETPDGGENSSDVPESCTVDGMLTYVSPSDGYCFAYPANFTMGTEDHRFPGLYGPKYDPESLEPLQVIMGIQIQPVKAGSDLTHLIDAYLSHSMFLGIPWEIDRRSITMGGEPAEVLEDIPGRGSSRHVLTIHHEALITLMFSPSDFPEMDADLTTLYDAVTGSFTYMDPAAQPQFSTEPQTVTWYDFDRRISLSYDPSMTLWLDYLTTPAVPVDPNVMVYDSQPARVQFRFLGYQGGQYQLPYPFTEPRVLIYPVKEFAGYGDDQPLGFLQQRQALSDVLENGLDPDACSQSRLELSSDAPTFFLPFLPWLSSSQAFCAQPEQVDFGGGRGIRYLTYYAQDAGPFLEGQVFYAFQGLTDDGEHYISAFFPVETGIFPATPPADYPICFDPSQAEECKSIIRDQLDRLNALGGSQFGPSLEMLDALVGSIRIEQPE